MSVLTVAGRSDMRLPRRERSGVAVSNFTIEALISADVRPPLANSLTSYDGPCCVTSSPTVPGLRQLTPPASDDWCTGLVDLAAMRRSLAAYELDSLTGKQLSSLMLFVCPVVVAYLLSSRNFITTLGLQHSCSFLGTGGR